MILFLWGIYTGLPFTYNINEIIISIILLSAFPLFQIVVIINKKYLLKHGFE